MAAAKPQGQALRVLAHSPPCPFPTATLHLQVAKAERRSASGGAQTEKAHITKTSLFSLNIRNDLSFFPIRNNRRVFLTLKRVKIISPRLHHFTAILQILRMVVNCSDSISITMGELFFNKVRRKTHLVKPC